MGRPLIQPPIKNKLLLWNVFVKWCSDGWTSVQPLAGGWEPPQQATAKACGEDLLSNCGWECVRGGVGAIIQHEGGSFQHLLSVSHHALLQQDISFLYSDSRVDEKEEL